MAYAYDVSRVTISGTAMGGAEEWATGFWLGSTDAAALTPSQASVDAIAAAWATFFSHTDAGISATYRTVQVKQSLVLGATGNVEEGNTYFHRYTTQPVGGKAGLATYPAQVTLVASLHGNPSIGLGGKGRMYLPGVNHGIDALGGLTSADRLKVANVLKAFFDTINASGTVGGSVINASQGRVGVPFAAPLNRVVSAVQIGSMYDTQRRRRNGLNEVYTAVAVVS